MVGGNYHTAVPCVGGRVISRGAVGRSSAGAKKYQAPIYADPWCPRGRSVVSREYQSAVLISIESVRRASTRGILAFMISTVRRKKKDGHHLRMTRDRLAFPLVVATREKSPVESGDDTVSEVHSSWLGV